MDERHWWLAGRIQESFKIGGFDNPTMLEDFMCQPDTMKLVNAFFSSGGPRRIFFYCPKPEAAVMSTRELHFTDSLSKLKEMSTDSVVILYFLRTNPEKDVDLSQFHKDIVSGEIKRSAIEQVTALLSDIYIPALKAQKDWGDCSEENKEQCIHTMERLLSSLVESASSGTQATRQLVLKHPESIVSNDFKQHRLAALDSTILQEYEELVSDWISTIESILADTSDERFLDPSAGPQSELERWRRRQRLLVNVTEQLKSKECKAVIGVLIQAKSKLLKKWKLIDAGITDAMNETKDKVKYMEALKRHIDQLYGDATPQSIMQTALPGLVNNIKQMDSISRFYARNGFLGLFFVKITNQLVTMCKDYILAITLGGGGGGESDETDELWSRVELEVRRGTATTDSPLTHDYAARDVRAQLESKLKTKGMQRDVAAAKEDGTLFGRMKQCIVLQSFFRECVHAVRDAVGSVPLSHFASMSSIGPPGSKGSKDGLGPSGDAKQRGSSRFTPGYTSPSKKSSTGESHGITMSDDDAILGHMESFCNRLRQIMDVMSTMTQYDRLTVTTDGIPRPRPEDLDEKGDDEYDQHRNHHHKDQSKTAEEAASFAAAATSYTPHHGGTSSQLNAIKEDLEKEEQEQIELVSRGADAEGVTRDRTKKEPDHEAEHRSLSADDVQILRKYYNDDAKDEGPSVSSVIRQHLGQMRANMMAEASSRMMLDVESQDRERFEHTYGRFQATVKELEKFLCAYITLCFRKNGKTWQILELLTKFTPISNRPGPRIVIAEKFVEAFALYEVDLEEIVRIYELFKEEPPVPRNAPPVAGAIYWARQLMRQIEEPMRIFRDVRAVSSLRDFTRVCKIYNRVASALVTFESLWFAQWKHGIEGACAGLSATLLVRQSSEGGRGSARVLVNADQRVMELIHEAKWFVRLGIPIPESAENVLRQEARFKSYNDRLQMAVGDFDKSVASIPSETAELFKPHIDAALQSFNPGLTTLAWNSMNIDAFLHQVHTSTGKLRTLVDHVNEVMEQRVLKALASIRDTFLFDYDLAFQNTWVPEDFIAVVSASVHTKADELRLQARDIEIALHEISGLLLSKKEKKGMNSIDTERAETRLIQDLLGTYQDRLYDAVLIATWRSLITLAEASGCPPDAIGDGASSRRTSVGHRGSPGSSSSKGSSWASRPRLLSAASQSSDWTWSTRKDVPETYLRFHLSVKYEIPNIIIEPPLEKVKDAVQAVAKEMLSAMKGLSWGNSSVGGLFYERVTGDDSVKIILHQLDNIVSELYSIVDQHKEHFSRYNFLWTEDINKSFTDFMSTNPGISLIEAEVARLQQIDAQIIAIPQRLAVGPIVLETDPVRNALHGFALAWKAKYAEYLHEEAKKKLETAELYRANVKNRLELSVTTLDQLNSTLHLLEEIRDMENKIDAIYLPIETMFTKLQQFDVRIPRGEMEAAGSLRSQWEELLALAERVRYDLLKDKRGSFEQELDKQLKTFVVEVIQFRNAFDAQGPAVVGILPEEAVARLHEFQQKFRLYDAKRKTLDSVSKLFGIKCKPFPELDKTGEELDLLGQLYGLFQKFIRFDKRFRDTLWAEVDLHSTNREVESYWDECLALPSKLKDWDAYHSLKDSIQNYLDVFPLLHRLAAKEIRNRHWLQVMTATGSSFLLEANVFKMYHVLDIQLIRYKAEIEEICYAAAKEMELEVKMRVTEEEWTEQVLAFEHYKRLGPVYLDKAFTERLLEQLEDAQALLAGMLTSKYIGPLREEAASWAEKLKEVSDVLEIWLEVQDLWQYLEEVFTNPAAQKELPQEAKKFGNIDKGWVKMMKRAYDTRNVLQCCYGGEVPKGVVLRHIYEELETCFRSLSSYLDSKRKAFPRFFLVSDPVLLAILSRPTDLESVRPHLRSLFSSVYDVQLEKSSLGGEEVEDSQAVTPTSTRASSRSRSRNLRGGSSSPDPSAVTPVKVDKRLTAVHALAPKQDLQVINMPSESLVAEAVILDAVAVMSVEGEKLTLLEEVSIDDCVEVWLQRLKQGIASSLHASLLDVIQEVDNGVAIEELPRRYVSQVCRTALLYYWTRECEAGIVELRYERRAMQNTKQRFQAAIGRLPAALARGAVQRGGLSNDEGLTNCQRLRTENLLAHSLYLRDIIDLMANRKIREPTDFDWRRNIRCYMHTLEGEKPEPAIYILESRFNYGCEFYGSQLGVALTPLTERCFLTMTQALGVGKGTIVQGPNGVGKTETVKGLSVVLANFLVTVHCDSNMSPPALGKMMQGIPLDGFWTCFDEVQLMPKEAMAIVLNCMGVILAAVRQGMDSCVIHGHEVPVKIRSLAVFMTHNPSTVGGGSSQLPSDVRAMFRTVLLAKPDYGALLRAKCVASGIKGPAILGTRLKIVRDLAKDILSSEAQSQLSIAAVQAVLARAVARRGSGQKGTTGTADAAAAGLDKQPSNVAFDRRDAGSKQQQQQNLPTAQGLPQAQGLPLAVLDDGSRSNSQASLVAAGTASNANPTSPAPAAKERGQAKLKGTPNPLTPAARVEHALVAQALVEVVGPRLRGEDVQLFKNIVKDVFSGLPSVPESRAALNPGVTSLSRGAAIDIEAALELQADEKGLVAHKPWMEKCLQLHSVSTVHYGIIVVGPPGSGKSSCIQTLVDALCVNPRGLSRGSHGSRGTGATATVSSSESNHRLQKINPCVVDDYSSMFGHMNPNGDWVDGIFTHAWRKATRNVSTTWLSMDGPLSATWADFFSSILDGDKTLHLKNGDKLFLSDNIKIIFETTDLALASPATLSRTGMVYIDKDVLGWRPIAKAWLEDRSHQQAHVLQRAFNKTVDAVSQYIANETKPKLKMSEVGLFQTCLKLLSAMLEDNVEIGGEAHIERLYLFCLMWTFGGLLDKNDRKGFSDLLKTLSTALPDDDRDICVFDYYVDESGEWDSWQSRVPEASYADHTNMLSEVFVDTADTIRTRILMEFASQSGQNVLLVGPSGSGKTSLINDFISLQDPVQVVQKKLVFSASSTARRLQQFIETNVVHRQGFVYGAKDKNRLQLFIDDINLPKSDVDGTQRVNELVRQLLDDKVLCTLEKPFEWKTIEGLTVMSAMSLSDQPSVISSLLSPRLMRHFAVFYMTAPESESLRHIVHSVLEVNMTANECPGLVIDLHNAIVSASCKLLHAVQRTLRPSSTPGREHYMFSVRDLAICFQTLKRLVEEDRGEESIVVSLWKYEMARLVRDRLCRTADVLWFDATIDKLVLDTWGSLPSENFHENYITFSTDARAYQRTGAAERHKQVKVMLQPLSDLKLVHNCLQAHITRYNEEIGNVKIDIMLSDHIILHVIKMHRILSLRHSGNAMLVGAVGSHLTALCRLALHVADVEVARIDATKRAGFLDGLRAAVRMTGSEGKVLAVVLSARELIDEAFLDAVNSLLVCGEYAHIFSNDEMEGLLQAIVPAMKREFPTGNPNPMKYFVSRVQMNLHIIICLPPRHKLLREAASSYPGLLNGCQVLWLCDWNTDFLLGEANCYIQKFKMSIDDTALSASITNSLANIHSFILKDCRQTVWAGDTSAEIQMVHVSVNEKKKDTLKSKTMKVPNLPYSKVMLLEQIRSRHRNVEMPARNEVFAGPMTYRRFLHCFRHIFNVKSKERAENLNELRKVITSIEQTRTDGRAIKEKMKDMRAQLESTSVKAAGLLQQLTAKATLVEKLKARIGQATALSAFLQMNDLSSDDDGDSGTGGEDLLKEEERDKYDEEFERHRELKMRSRQVKAIEELAAAKKKVEDCRTKLQYSREQVTIWKSRVDRPCIDRVKSFTNPSILVVQVMEMVMILIGKRMSFAGASKEHGGGGGAAKEMGAAAKAANANYPSEEMSGRVSASSSGTRVTKKAQPLKKEMPDKFDRQQWKLMQLAMNDSTKFVDMLHNVPWEDGLPEEILESVESYLARGANGQLGVTGEGTLLDNAADKTFQAQRRSPSPENSRGITIAAAKFSSEDAATLVQYTIAIVEYTRLCGPLRAAIDKMHELEREIEENERLQKEKAEESANEGEQQTPTPERDDEAELDEDDLPRLQVELEQLQKQYDQSIVEKHTLDLQLQSMSERLKAASEVVESLKGQEKEWRRYVGENASPNMLYLNCIVAAAYLTYCGAFDWDTRRRVSDLFVHICEHHGLPLPKRVLFKSLELFDYLYTAVDKQQLQLLRLPMTPLMLENATFIMQEDNYRAWPLLCDPSSRSIAWMRSYKQGIVEVKYSELRSQLDTCLSDGLPLLVTDVDLESLQKDPRFAAVLSHRHKFMPVYLPFKLMIGDHEVECSPSFRLYLHSAVEAHCVPEAVATYVQMIYFHMGRPDIEAELLSRFVAREKPRLEEEQLALHQEQMENLRRLNETVAKMRASLASECRVMHDLQAAKRLADMKKQHDERLESQSRIDYGLSTIDKAKEGFLSIATRGAVCFDVNQYMRELNPIYLSSFRQFLDVFDAAILHSERAPVKAVVDRLTYSSYLATVRTLLERDRLVYSLALAMEIEDSQERIGIGEREYVVSPQHGAQTVQATLPSKSVPATDKKVSDSKKPFDWMTDDQFHNLQLLAQNFDWFVEMFDRMSRDGREMVWRNLCEGEAGETAPLPDKMDDVLTPIQRLCVIRAVRNDRTVQAATQFIATVLGKKYISGGVAIDLSELQEQTTARTPILLLYTFECEAVERLFVGHTTKKQLTAIILPITDPASEPAARDTIKAAASTGTWVLLTNGHNAPQLLSAIDTILSEVGHVHADFRCWISAVADIDLLPANLLQTAVKIVIDSPKAMKDNMIRSFSWIDSEALKQSSRSEWPALLHNICYVHGAVRLRARYGKGGFNSVADLQLVGSNELLEALGVALSEFKDNLTAVTADGSAASRSTSWNGLRFMISELIYGSYVSDPYDQQAINAIVEYWISPGAVKRDFELSKLKYRHPAAFFNAHPRLSQLNQALDGLPNHSLDSPEACHVHPSSDYVELNLKTHLGDDQYIFTRLNKVLDVMPGSKSLSHKLFPRPPTPFEGPPLLMANQAATSGGGGGAAAASYPLEHGVFATASFAALKTRKEVELYEIVFNVLPKLPKAYSKEYISDRVKKIGGNTPFNSWLVKELEIFFQLLSIMKSTLQAIRNAVDVNSLGDVLTPVQLACADDLYYQKIPEPWRRACGTAAPYATMSLSSFVNDILNRNAHFEKILVLGREKNPAYWLGCFTCPQGLLAIVKQEYIRQSLSHDRSGNVEQFVLQTEITNRDKDHLRDPPAEGMFIHGIFIWGASWEKTTGELLDAPPKYGYTSLPVILVTCWPQSEKPALQDPAKALETYQCPVYASRIAPREPIMELDLRHENIPATRWAMRSLCGTIRPY